MVKCKGGTTGKPRGNKGRGPLTLPLGEGTINYAWY
jgi:hypothetical protein